MPIPSQFHSQAELVNYLETLERRVQQLEQESSSFKTDLSVTGSSPVPIQVQRWLERFIPHTGLFSSSFLARSFTVWGHYFVAQLIISAGFLVVYLIGMLIIAASVGH
jgi:hypothetical protein